MIGRLLRTPVYPLLFAMYPILALFAQNAQEVPAAELPPVLAAGVGLAAIAWLGAGLILRDAAKGALVAAVVILTFYSLGAVIAWSEDFLTRASTFWVSRGRVVVWPVSILVPEALVLCGLAAWLAGRPKPLVGWTRFLNLLAAMAVIMPASQILTIKAPTATRSARVASPLARLAPPTGSRLPDIYYIILDGYARHDVMMSHFDFDNTAFLDHLEQKGFFVARKSTANYAQTPLCLSASLNATYLDDLVKGLGADQTQLKGLISQNDLMASLRPLGYRHVTFATGFEPTEHTEADHYLSPHSHTTEFQRMVIDMTTARVIWPDPRQMDRYLQARERITYLLEHLPEVARDPHPTFAFAHILCPHPPMIFGANGEDVGRRQEPFMLHNNKANGRFRRPEIFRSAYRDQAAYITRRIQDTIDRILAESPEPPLIIVQSDHGSELNLDMASVSNTDLHERMSILNAYYFPGRRYEGLYDSISPVNSFRVVLNTVFGARLPLLPDRSFYSTWPEPYQFIDVTGVVRGDASGQAAASGCQTPFDPDDS